MLTGQAIGGNLDNLSQSLLNASVDINPHRIEAALFAFKSPLTKGIILADEVVSVKQSRLALCYANIGQSARERLSSYALLRFVSNGDLN